MISKCGINSEISILGFDLWGNVFGRKWTIWVENFSHLEYLIFKEEWTFNFQLIYFVGNVINEVNKMPIYYQLKVLQPRSYGLNSFDVVTCTSNEFQALHFGINLQTLLHPFSTHSRNEDKGKHPSIGIRSKMTHL